MTMSPFVTGSKKTPLQTVLLLVGKCCAIPLALYLIPLALYLGFFIVFWLSVFSVSFVRFAVAAAMEAAEEGNHWLALLIVNLAGTLVALAIRPRRKKRLITLPSEGRC